MHNLLHGSCVSQGISVEKYDTYCTRVLEGKNSGDFSLTGIVISPNIYSTTLM